MNSAAVAFFSAFALFCDYALTQPVRYDQRQEGDLNVRTDLEDVLFVMVMPQDLISGMGLVAANTVDLLRKNYGGLGPERWPMRAPAKIGFVPMEKSPYKIDLEKSGVKVKKIPHVGDPNRYNFNDGKLPTKGIGPEVKVTTPAEVPEKPTMETTGEVQSTTENKTVKKVLKPEDMRTAEEKKPVEVKKDEVKKTDEAKKDEKIEPVKKSEEVKKDEKVEPMKESEELKPTAEKLTWGDELKVVGDSMDPTSLLNREGCGPDARRDSTGRCVYMQLENNSKQN